MISVCIASFNGAAFIEEQILSVLGQLSEGDEVVIADDGSTDGTVAKVNAIGDKRIRWVGDGKNRGVIKNFEQCLAAARGNIIFLCDQDDIWLPDKVGQCVLALQKHLLVVTDCIVVDESLAELSPSFFSLRNSGKGVLRNLWKNSYLGCCMAFRRELLDICLPIPSSVPMHDMWIGMLGDAHGSTLFLPKKCSLYRRHFGATSQAAGRSSFSFFRKLRIRLVLITHVVLRLIVRKVRQFSVDGGAN